MRAACLAAALALLIGGCASGADAPQNEVVQSQKWRLVVRRDPFTQQAHCRLSGRNMRVEGTWVVFSLGRSVDSSDAYVRIDDALARSVRDIAPSPYRADWAADEAVFNPSGGEVAVPSGLLLQGRALWIRPSPNASVRRFEIEGLGHALGVAAARGC